MPTDEQITPPCSYSDKCYWEGICTGACKMTLSTEEQIDDETLTRVLAEMAGLKVETVRGYAHMHDQHMKFHPPETRMINGLPAGDPDWINHNVDVFLQKIGFSPLTDWRDLGPLIEAHHVDLNYLPEEVNGLGKTYPAVWETTVGDYSNPEDWAFGQPRHDPDLKRAACLALYWSVKPDD